MADDLKVVLETGDANDGTNGANNAAVAAGMLQVVSLLPDLEIASVAGPATMALGRPMTVPFTVRNTGLTAAGAFRVRFYLAPASPPPNPGAGVDVGFRAFTALAAGAILATTAVVTVPGNLSQTSYLVSAVADADGQVTEIIEGTTANGRVAATPTTLVRPDLIVSRLDVAGLAAARAARGGTLTLRNVTVKNAAATPGYAPASTLKFYLSGDAVLDGGDFELTPAVTVPALAPGASFAAIPTLTIPASAVTGARFLIARANALGNVPESDTTNDTASASVEIGDFADLKITAVAGPTAAGTGRPMTVSFTTRNAGIAPVGPFRVTLFMAIGPNPPPVPDDGTDVGFKDFTGLAAGASLASTFVVNVPASFEAGSYFLSAVADTGNAIPEAPGNDGPAANGLVALKTIIVIRPDLVVSALTGPPRAARGGVAAVTATVKNLAASPATAPASSLKFYLSDDQTFDAGDVSSCHAVRTVPILGPGGVSTAITDAGHPGLGHARAKSSSSRVPTHSIRSSEAARGQQRSRMGDRDRRLRGSADRRRGRARRGGNRPADDRVVHHTQRRHRPGGAVPCDPVHGDRAESAAGARRRHRCGLQGLHRARCRHKPGLDVGRQRAGELRGGQLLPVRGRRYGQRHPGSPRQRRLRGQRPRRAQDDHRHPTRSRGERAHRAAPRRTWRRRRGHRDGQEPRGVAGDRAGLVAQVLSLRRSDLRRRGRGAVSGPHRPDPRPRRNLDRDHDARHPGLGHPGTSSSSRVPMHSIRSWKPRGQ